MGIGNLTRRAFGRALTGAVVSFPVLSPASERLGWNAPIGTAFELQRRYRADAQVLLLSIPILNRENVGGGAASWRETPAGAEAPMRLLEFSGFSNPARAAGLNRLGFFRELSRLGAGQITECIYFGLMTSSPEESAEDARKALHSTVKELIYSAIEGRIAPREVETASVHFTAPASLSGEQNEDLTRRAREALTNANRTSSSLPLPPTGACSFLEAIAGLLSRPDRDETAYIYSGRLYRMSVRRSRDEKMTALLKERGVISAGKNLVRLAARLRRQLGGKETEFRIWVEEGAPRALPVRIEYQAKSYLRLVFEAERA